MALWGTIINVLAIIIGSLIGSVFPRISDGIRNTVMQGLGLAVIILGISMALKTSNILIVIISLVLGGIVGELMRIEYWLQRAGSWLEKVVRRGKKRTPNQRDIAEGFITATLIYCIGAMSILGALDSGLRHNHDILYTKAMLDGISALIFTTTLGIGVMFSSIPVFIYQGTMALTATLITWFISTSDLNLMIAEVTAVGGVMIIGIGLNVLNIKKINVANMLPSIFIAAAIIFLNLQLEWINL